MIYLHTLHKFPKLNHYLPSVFHILKKVFDLKCSYLANLKQAANNLATKYQKCYQNASMTQYLNPKSEVRR